MSSVVRRDEMESELLGSLGRFSLLECDRLGPYLRLNVEPFRAHLHPGWRQTRSSGSLIFSIDGAGEAPSLEQIAVWTEIDDDFSGFADRCVAMTVEYVDELLNESDLRVERGCLEAIAEAGRSETLELTHIGVGSNNKAVVHMTYPRWDDYYLFPLVFCRGRRVEEVIITP